MKAAHRQIRPQRLCRDRGIDGLTIRKGRHTAAVTVRATDEILSDPKAFTPYYALGFRIVNADADVLVKEKSFEVIAVKCENRFYGNWYHGGRTVVRSDATGEVVSTDEYELTLPQADSKVYRLTTVDAVSVKTDRMGGRTGSLLLTFNGDDITVSSADGSDIIINPIQGHPSRFNGAKLLQDREISLNYCYSNGDGTTTYVYDVLKFRNRVRDGINEWQSETAASLIDLYSLKSHFPRSITPAFHCLETMSKLPSFSVKVHPPTASTEFPKVPSILTLPVPLACTRSAVERNIEQSNINFLIFIPYIVLYRTIQSETTILIATHLCRP